MSTNEYGVRLDSNGYAPSLLRTESCFLCRARKADIVRHEIYHGPYRRKSKEYGLWVNLCTECHYDVHNSDGADDQYLKEVGEFAALEHYKITKQEFINLFGKNYI